MLSEATLCRQSDGQDRWCPRDVPACVAEPSGPRLSRIEFIRNRPAIGACCQLEPMDERRHTAFLGPARQWVWCERKFRSPTAAGWVPREVNQTDALSQIRLKGLTSSGSIDERERVGSPTAEGATAPETLRHPDRQPINTLESGAAAPAEGVSRRRLKRGRPNSQANDRGGMHAVHASLPGAFDEHLTLSVGLDPIVVRFSNVIRYIRSGPSLSAQSSTCP